MTSIAPDGVLGVSMTTSEIVALEHAQSAVSWPAVIAGGFVAASASLVLTVLGSGFGLAAASPWSGAHATAFVVAAGLWLIVTQWIAAGLGGYLTGRLRTRWAGVHTHEVFFRETAHGIIVAHCYQYEPAHSTWVIETTPECWAAHGFDRLREDEAARALETIFAEELEGHPLLVNRALWRNFPKISCANWSHGRIVLLGDAMATAAAPSDSGGGSIRLRPTMPLELPSPPDSSNRRTSSIGLAAST